MNRPEIEVDLGAIRRNVEALRAHSGTPVMAVVKADGYGHGLVEAARAAQAGGAAALGVAVLDEALALRSAGVQGRLLSWLAAPGEEYDAAVEHGVEISLNALWALDEAVAAARRVGRPLTVHLKADTGLSRGGAVPADWPDLVTAAADAQRRGLVRVEAVWSHFAYADAPGHATIARQRDVLDDAVRVARAAGLDVRVHLANSAATLLDPAAHHDLVRPGVAVYGLDPTGGDPARFGLRPAQRVSAPVALVKRVPAGSGVSYGHTYVTDRETTLALVPVGYADGIPRAAGNRGPVLVNGRRFTVSGRVCMDQFVVDVGDHPVAPGDRVTLWGAGDDGAPTAQDWADAVDTIHYEIVTRVGGRFRRRHVG